MLSSKKSTFETERWCETRSRACFETFYLCGAGVTDISGEPRRCSHERITVEAVRVLGSCLYKECHAAGKTDRFWFSRRASVLEGRIVRVNKSQDSCFADLKAARYMQQEM